MYGAREMQGQRAMACACFEYLQRRLGGQRIGRRVDVNVEQRNDEVCVRRVYLRVLAHGRPETERAYVSRE